MIVVRQINDKIKIDSRLGGIVKKSILVLILIFLILKISAQNTEQYDYVKQVERKKTKEFLEYKKNDQSIYYGIGYSIIGKDLNEALEEAKNRALKSLTEQIEVRVESDVTAVTISEEKSMKSKKTVVEQSIIKDITATYTNKTIEGFRYKDFINYPKDGEVCCITWLSKSEYDRKVKQELQGHRNRIRTALEDGLSQMKNGNIVTGIQHLMRADAARIKFFKDLPVIMDVDGDGTAEEIKAYIENIIVNTMNSIELRTEDNNYNYNSDGVLSSMPQVTAAYYDENGQCRELSNLPLKIEFIKGSGRILGRVKTNSYGMAQIQLRDIDASYLESMISIKVDSSQLEDIDEYNINLPEVTIILKKIKTVALVVHYIIDGKKYTLESLVTQIKRALMEHGFASVDFQIEKPMLSTIDIKKAASLNFEYLVEVFIETTKPQTVGGYDNMFACSAQGTISVYQLPRGDQLATDIIPSFRGVGTTAHSASMHSIGKAEHVIYQKTINMIGRLQ